MRVIMMLNLPGGEATNPVTVRERNALVARTLLQLAERVAAGEVRQPCDPANMAVEFTTTTDTLHASVYAPEGGDPLGTITYARPTYYVAELQHPGYIRDHGRRRR